MIEHFQDFHFHVFFVFSCCSLLGVGDMWRKPFTKHRWFRKKTRGKSTKLHSWEVYCRTPASDPRSCSQQACTVAVDQSCQRLASKDAWVFKTSLCRKTKTARSPCSLQRCRPCSCPSPILKLRCRCCNQSPAAAIRSQSAADTTRQWLAGCWGAERVK